MSAGNRLIEQYNYNSGIAMKANEQYPDMDLPGTLAALVNADVGAAVTVEKGRCAIYLESCFVIQIIIVDALRYSAAAGGWCNLGWGVVQNPASQGKSLVYCNSLLLWLVMRARLVIFSYPVYFQHQPV
jgi:hypothetical protein